MNTFLLMIQLFTKLPIKREIAFDQKKLKRGIVFFPLVGLLIGTVVTIPSYAADLLFGREISIVTMIFFTAAFTGALHLDGLADTMDGILSARSREKMLLIMKDSRIGTHGVLTLIILILMKYLFLLKVDHDIFFLMLIVLPIVGRTAIGIVLYGSRYAREDGLGNLFIGKSKGIDSFITGIIGMFFIFLFLNMKGMAAFAMTLVFTYMFKLRLEKTLGGLTGDTLGAVNEVAELVFIPIFILMYRGGSLL